MSAFEAVEHESVVQVGGEVVSVAQGRRQAIALHRLFLSQQNVRKVRNPESVPALAVMIESQGLLYPLCVVAERPPAPEGAQATRRGRGRQDRKDKKGRTTEAAAADAPEAAPADAADTFGVVAGGRRLAALRWLVTQGRMAADAPVECLVFDAGRGTAVSLTENVAQEAMHPADQLVAFKALVEQGHSAGQIAAAFGVSVLTVGRRLKLGSLAPQFIDLYREGAIAMDVLQALALSDDPVQQVQVWASLEPYNRNAYQIRQLLTRDETSTESPLAVFVGIEAYRAAGGSVREDLFSTEGTSFLQDSALLNRLALDKLEAEAARWREAGWKWAEARISFPYADRSRFAQLRCEKVPPSRQEHAAMRALQADQQRVRDRVDELEALVDGDDAQEDREWTPEEAHEHDSLEDQWQALDELRDAMDEALHEWTPKQKGLAGVVLCIDSRGRVQAAEGLVRADDRQVLAQAGEQGQGGEGGERDSDEDQAGATIGGRSGAPTYDSTPKERAEFSASLCQNLTAHRTAAVAAAFTQNPQAALAALLHTLIVHEREPWQSSPLNVRFDSNAHGIGGGAAQYDETPAAQLIAQAEVIYDKLPGDSARLFDHLQAMDVAGLLEVLALFVGRAYSVQCGDPVRQTRRGFDAAHGIERVLGVDMADWWSPTPERYLRHIPKAKMIAAVTEACGAPAAQPLEKMKKDEAVKAAAALLEGRRWLPSTLQSYATGSAGADDEGVDDEGVDDLQEGAAEEAEQGRGASDD